MRCPYCHTNWPPLEDYDLCPVCLEPTTNSQNEPIAEHAAEIELRHARFGWWLWENERL